MATLPTGGRGSSAPQRCAARGRGASTAVKTVNAGAHRPVVSATINRVEDATMKSDAGSNASVWTAMADMPAGFELARDEEADVCVIGAGIAGLTTAYRLAGE